MQTEEINIGSLGCGETIKVNSSYDKIYYELQVKIEVTNDTRYRGSEGELKVESITLTGNASKELLLALRKIHLPK